MLRIGDGVIRAVKGWLTEDEKFIKEEDAVEVQKFLVIDFDMDHRVINSDRMYAVNETELEEGFEYLPGETILKDASGNTRKIFLCQE